MGWKVGTHRKLVFGSVLLLGLVALSGCFGLGDDGSAADTGQDVGTLSDATRALREAGYADPYLDTEATGVLKEFDIWMDFDAVVEPFEGREMLAFTFTDDPDRMGTVPGPEIRVTQGDTVRVNFHDTHASDANDLPEGHTMHWHGVDVPWAMDGVPFVTQSVSMGPGTATYTYEFVAKQAGTYWYHCVFAFPAHLDSGMFGAFIVEPQDASDDLPFDREQTLFWHEMDSQWLAAGAWVINSENQDPNPDTLPDNPFDLLASAQNQARLLSDAAGIAAGQATGEYLFAEGPREYYDAWSPRYKPTYDTFMVNGKSYPETEPVYINEGETLRLRLINAGQLHKSLHLHGHHVLVTHIDGYPLDHPHWEDTINLAPGERKDVYVQGTNPGIWSLHDHSGSSGMGSTVANDYAFPGGMMTHLVYEDFEPPGQLPKPTTGATGGDFAVYAPSYENR